MDNKNQSIAIVSEFITLGQFLKFAHVISFGGEAKGYLATRTVYVNDEPEQRRGRKLRPGDMVRLDKGTFEIVRE